MGQDSLPDRQCASVAESPFNHIQAIVFDLDDTLYPQISYKRSGFKIVASWLASKFNLEQAAVLAELEDILTEYGPSYPYMFDQLVERLGINEGVVSELVRRFIVHEPQIGCYEGVIPMLSRLRSNFRLGILTDGRYTVQQKKISALELEKKVHEILYSNAMGMEKPALELFQWFEKRFKMDGDNILYVGDNPKKDFHGANLRKWTTVMVGTGEGLSELCDPSYKAQHELISITDLEKLLAENSEGLEENVH